MQSTAFNGHYQFSKHEFDLLASSKKRFVNVKIAEVRDAFRLSEFISDYLGLNENCLPLVKDLIFRNRGGVFLFEKEGVVVGFYALQMLNEDGLNALLQGDFNGGHPAECFLSRGEKVPVCFYVWSFIAPGLAANGIRYVSCFLQQAKFRTVNFYARPVTAEGLQITLDFGFEPISAATNGLYCYTRLVNRGVSLQLAA